MVEELFELMQGDERAVEKVIMNEHLNYIHMIFNNGEGLPEHYANSTLYMTVVRGMLTLGLDDQDDHKYKAGSLIKIPFKTKMNVNNKDDVTLELIVLKVPAPGTF